MRRETIAVHAGFDCDPTTKAVGRADLPVGRLRLRQRRPRRGAVQPRGGRLPLQPHQQPDQRRSWNSGSRELEGGVAGVSLASGQAALHYAIVTLADHGGNIVTTPQLYGTTHTLLSHVLTPAGHRGPLRRQRRRRRHRGADRRRDPRGVLRERRQPGRQHLRHRGDRRGRAPARRAADRRQHGGDADPAAPDRARRRHRRALADQVHGRPRHGHGRHGGRRRPLRLGAPTPSASRMFSEPDESYHGLVYTERFGARGLRRADAQRLPAHHRRGAGADERLPAAAGHRDGGAAGRAACRERPQGGGIPARRSARRLGQLRRLRGQPLLRPGATSISAARRPRC